MPGARAASTAHIRYRIDPGLGMTEDELNARVRRIHPAKNARTAAIDPVFAERTGRLTVPLLTLHETGDVWVPLSLEQSYRRRTIAAGRSTCSCSALSARRRIVSFTARRVTGRSTISSGGSSAA